MPGDEKKPEPELLTDAERIALEFAGASQCLSWGPMAPGWEDLPVALREKVLRLREQREAIRRERRGSHK